jgi:hypothetical protein
MPLVKEIKATANVSFEVILGAFLIAHFADHRESPTYPVSGGDIMMMGNNLNFTNDISGMGSLFLVGLIIKVSYKALAAGLGKRVSVCPGQGNFEKPCILPIP